MLTNIYVTSCQLSDLSLLQKAKAITYSVAYDTENSSIIKIMAEGKGLKAIKKFKCMSSFRDCIELVTFLKENCVCPEHCKDIASDLGYSVLSVAQ